MMTAMSQFYINGKALRQRDEPVPATKQPLFHRVKMTKNCGSRSCLWQNVSSPQLELLHHDFVGRWEAGS